MIAQLPKDLAANLPSGKVPQNVGEAWLQVSLLDNGKSGLPMLGGYVRDGQKLVFTPRFPLEPDSTYRASLLLGGKTLESVEYKVPARPLASPTEIVSVWPTSDVLPANHLRFYIKFSRPMRGGPDIFRQIRLIDSDGNAVDDPWLPDELWNEAGTILTLYIHPGRIKWGVLLRWLLGPVLEPDRHYTLVVSSEMLDADKRKLVKEFRKSFRTIDEDRVRIDLPTWKLQPPKIGGRDPVILTLPKSLDHVCLQRYLTVVDAKGSPVPGKVEVPRDARSWKFVPTTAWTDQQYRINVDPQLEDPCGNTPASPFDVDADAPQLKPQPLFLPFRAKVSEPRTLVSDQRHPLTNARL